MRIDSRGCGTREYPDPQLYKLDSYPLIAYNYIYKLIKGFFITMANIFFASDHHFHHSKILTFNRDDGTPLRVFKDVDHMNEHIVNQHNARVRPGDKVYFLGDVAMSRNARGLEILGRMNGEKVLVKGNHDMCTANQYLKYFKDIRGTHQFQGIILSHIPIHSESLARWGINVHGHLHYQKVRMPMSQIPDRRYFNVSMECLDNYTPISLEEIKKNVGMSNIG